MAFRTCSFSQRLQSLHNFDIFRLAPGTARTRSAGNPVPHRSKGCRGGCLTDVSCCFFIFMSWQTHVFSSNRNAAECYKLLLDGSDRAFKLLLASCRNLCSNQQGFEFETLVQVARFTEDRNSGKSGKSSFEFVKAKIEPTVNLSPTRTAPMRTTLECHPKWPVAQLRAQPTRRESKRQQKDGWMYT